MGKDQIWEPGADGGAAEEPSETPQRSIFFDPPHPGPIPEVLREPVAKPEPARAQSAGSSLAGMGAAWGMAIDFLVTIGAGILLGWGLDRWQHTAPWGVLGGMALGFTGALVRIVRQTQRAERREAEARSRRPNRP